MRQEEALDRAVENNNVYMLIGFERRDDLVQLRNSVRTKDIQRRVIKRHAPIGWSSPCETNLPAICHVAHVCLRGRTKTCHLRMIRWTVCYPATSNMTSNSTGVPNGRLATPYTSRQGLLSFPKTSLSSPKLRQRLSADRGHLWKWPPIHRA
jgi:hypothetical protein